MNDHHYNNDSSNSLNSDQQQTEEAAADDDEALMTAGGSCEIGSLEMPPAEWLFQAAAQFQQSYGQVHPYLAVGLCIAGTLMNLVTVLVLTRPTMRSPVNVLLCAVACCDIVVESSYLVFVLHFLLASAQRCEPSDFSWAWAIFMMFHAHVSVIFHAASIWMTVSLAQIRVLTIRRATTGPTTPLITERFTAVLALLTTLVVTLVNVPNFLTFEIMEVPASAMLPCWQPPPPFMQQQQQQFTFQTTTTAKSGVSSSTASFSPQTTTTTLPHLVGINQTETNMALMMGTLIANLTTTTAATPMPSRTTLLSTLAQSVLNRTRRQHRLKRFRRDVGTGGGQEQTEWMINIAAAAGAFEEPMVYTVRAHESDCMKLKLAFWSNGMLFKVIPCLLLTVSIAALLRIIAEVAHKRKNLAQVMRKKVPKDHTTPMLAAILLIFLIAELPQGVFLVLNGIFSSESFHKRVYLPLGDLMDLLSLLNSAVGFLIYVGMSRKFRTVFLQLIFSALSCLLSKSPCLPDGMPSSTGGDSAAVHGGANGRSWRGPATSTAGGGGNSQYQQLLACTNHMEQCKHSTTLEQPSCCGTTALLAVNGSRRTARSGGGGGGVGKWYGGKKQKGGRGGTQPARNGGGGRCEQQQWAAKWQQAWIRRWRRISTRTTTEMLTASSSRAEQLSLGCRNSITGTPSLTLAMSYSAGITAAAASVGVHMVHLDEMNNNNKKEKNNKKDGTAANNNNLSKSPSICSLAATTEVRRPSSQMSNAQYLEVPSRRTTSSNLRVSEGGGGGGPKRTGSFHSLCDHPIAHLEEEEDVEDEGSRQKQLERPQKRISFNLPPEQNDAIAVAGTRRKRRKSARKGSNNRDSGENANAIGGRQMKRPSGGGIGFGTRLRRSFMLSLKKKQQELMLANSRMMSQEAQEMISGVNDGEVDKEPGEGGANGVAHSSKRGSAAGSGAIIRDCCPGRALLKLQQQQHECDKMAAASSDQPSKPVSSTLAKTFFAPLNNSSGGGGTKQNGGSGMMMRRETTATTTNFPPGWTAYC